MPNPQIQATLTQNLLDRIAAGDNLARETLISHYMERLRRLASVMLRERAAVRRWEDTDDVLQNALVRLNRALQVIAPESPRKFIGLAAAQIRRELIDLYRHHYGQQGHGAHHESDFVHPNLLGEASPSYDSPDRQMNPSVHAAIHEAIEMLPAELKDVFDMTFYGGMTQQEIANVLDVSTKTIKRRWRDARLLLQEKLAD